MEIKEFHFSFNELDIDKTLIDKVLQPGNAEIPDHFSDMIDNELEIAATLAGVAGGYLILEPVIIDKFNEQIRCGEHNFQVGKNISVYLQHSEILVLMLCTAGPGIEIRSKQLMKEGHYPEGFITDIIGSIVVEAGMDKLYEILSEDMLKLGFNVSNRYSPGYCAWNVSEQQKLFSFFPENFAGISLSESSLMNPIKSVSAIAGAGKKIKRLAYMCDTCTLTNCTFRNLKS